MDFMFLLSEKVQQPALHLHNCQFLLIQSEVSITSDIVKQNKIKLLIRAWGPVTISIDLKSCDGDCDGH